MGIGVGSGVGTGLDVGLTVGAAVAVGVGSGVLADTTTGFCVQETEKPNMIIEKSKVNRRFIGIILYSFYL